MSTITKLARYQVRHDAVARTVEAVKAFVDEVSRKEGGTARYEAYQDTTDPTRFTHVMSFRTPSAEEYHQKTAWNKRFLEAVAPACVQPIAFETVEKIS